MESFTERLGGLTVAPFPKKGWGGTLAATFVLFSLFTVAAWSQGSGSTTTSASTGVKLHPLNVKTGLWETTTTWTIGGEMPIPASMLNKLTPEQRARLEERMKANSAANTHTDTDKKCLTKEDLEKADFGAGKENCKQTIVTSTSAKAEGNFSCEVEGAKMSGTVEIEAIDQEHVKGSAHGTATGGGRTMTSSETFTSKWLAPACKPE